jgi:hypothetical protein
MELGRFCTDEKTEFFIYLLIVYLMTVSVAQSMYIEW